MDTTPIVARLSVIANSVNALKELQKLTVDFERYVRYISEYLAKLEKQS